MNSMQIKPLLRAALIASSLFTSSILAMPLVQASDAESINVNTASAEEIARVLVGVGLSKAQAIVEYREANGGFEDVYELENVKGIGSRTVSQNETRIRLK